jgi:predicted NBD/HSP70 family sugar kinase
MGAGLNRAFSATSGRTLDAGLRDPVTRAVGIDVGGTKIAAGLVDVENGHVLAREELPTRPERGGREVLADCAALARALESGALPIGFGLCELVGLDGRLRARTRSNGETSNSAAWSRRLGWCSCPT